jgi:hypothetical protein
MRVFRSATLLGLGAIGGFAAAAAVAKQVLPSRGDAGSDELGLFAIFDGIDLKSTAPAFRGGSAFAWFGGINLDLREATLAEDAHLSVGALFGGVAVQVPPGWRVETDVRALSGGVDVARGESDDPDAPLLVIDGVAAFGGVAVRRKVKPDPPGETP